MTWERLLTVETDHPSFAGHFPGDPLLPGAALLAHYVLPNIELPKAVQTGACTLTRLKFTAAVRPGDQLRLTRRIDPEAKRCSFDVERRTNVPTAPWSGELCAVGGLRWN